EGLWLQLDRLAQRRLGLIVAVERGEIQREVLVKTGAQWIARNRSLRKSGRFVEPAKAKQQPSQTVHRHRILCRNLDSAAKFRFRSNEIEIEIQQDRALC